MNFPRIAIFLFLAINLPLFSMSNDEISEKELHAISLFRQGKNQDAINLLSEIINIDTKNDKKFRNQIKEAYYWLGKACIRNNDFDAAKKNLEFYIANFKSFGENYEDAYYENAMMYYTEKKYQTAADLFVNFLNEFPNSANVAKVCYQIGESLYQLSLYDDSLVYFKLGSLAPAPPGRSGAYMPARSTTRTPRTHQQHHGHTTDTPATIYIYNKVW